MANEKATSSGIGFCGLLTIVFITLKLCGVIQWGWLMVFAPLWMPFLVVLGVCAVMFLLAAILGGKR